MTSSADGHIHRTHSSSPLIDERLVRLFDGRVGVFGVGITLVRALVELLDGWRGVVLRRGASGVGTICFVCDVDTAFHIGSGLVGFIITVFIISATFQY